MKAADLKLRSGHFSIITGAEPDALDKKHPFMTYTENETWYAVCSPDGGVLYDSQITLPAKLTESINISAIDASVVTVPLYSGTITADLRNSGAELTLAARRVICRLGRGSAVIKAAPSVAAVFECGNGSMDIFLPPNQRGYRYSIVRGAGSVSINSVSQERNAAIGPMDGIPISIRCGLGTVNVREY